MLYLSFGDAPSGVLTSQVFDVVKYCRSLSQQRISCVVFISVRNYFKNRSIIRNQISDCWIMPMWPTIHLWQLNYLTLAFICLVTLQRNVIARNALAVKLALMVKKMGLIHKIVLDGRGAIAAEWHEYNVMPNKKLKSKITQIEQQAVLHVDFRLAVSTHLVQYWQKHYGYSDSKHVVIPCTISFENLQSKQTVNWPFNADDIVMVYAGSVAGWQSFELLKHFLTDVLGQDSKHKVLFLSKANVQIASLQSSFKTQVQHMWLPHGGVLDVLQQCDYGILIREQSNTNMVASPTKFAEYLLAGLNVFISKSLGDYTDFVIQHGCGNVWEPGLKMDLQKTTTAQKQKNQGLAKQYFSKENYKEQYKTLLAALN
jgi:hypothetical protein